MTTGKLSQINVRVEQEIERSIDAKRIELSAALGYIPSRSEVIRMALIQFVGTPPAVTGELRDANSADSPPKQ